MSEAQVLGLPLEDARAKLAAGGQRDVTWRRTTPPRGAVGEEERVVQVRPGPGEGLTVVTACFPALPGGHER
jgi:hypothetical protein